MTSFGDSGPDDSYNPAPADPLQIARRLHELRRHDRLERKDWDRLSRREQDVLIGIIGALFAWMRREGTTP